MQIDNLEGTDIKLEIAFWKRQEEAVKLRDHLMKFLLTEDNSNGWEPWEEDDDFGDGFTQILAKIRQQTRKSQNEFFEDPDKHIKEIAEVSRLCIDAYGPYHWSRKNINLNYQFKENKLYEGEWRLKAGRYLLDGQTLLHAACWHIKPKFVLSLLRHGADPNKQVSENYSKTLLKWNNPIGYTPLNVMLSRVISTDEEHSITFDEQRIKDFKNIIEYLLDFGADPNIGSTLCVKKTLYTALGFIRHETFQNKFGIDESKSLEEKLIQKGALTIPIQEKNIPDQYEFDIMTAITNKEIMSNKTTLGFEVKERINKQIKQLLNKFDEWPSKVTDQTECSICFEDFPLEEKPPVLVKEKPPVPVKEKSSGWKWVPNWLIWRREEKKEERIKNKEKIDSLSLHPEEEKTNLIVKLKCGHVFHYTCLYNWWESFEDKTKFNCPFCRALGGEPKSWKHAHMFPYYKKMYPNNNKITKFEGWALSNKMKLKF